MCFLDLFAVWLSSWVIRGESRCKLSAEGAESALAGEDRVALKGVRNRLKTAHAKKPIQLPVYQWLSEGEVWRSNRLGRERWGDNELSREIRAIEWAPGRQMFKHAFAYRPQHQCDGVSPSKESWEQEDLFSVGVSSSASQDQKLEHSEMRQVLYIQKWLAILELEPSIRNCPIIKHSSHLQHHRTRTPDDKGHLRGSLLQSQVDKQEWS